MNTSKNPKLNEVDRTVIQSLAEVMMQMNARNDANANQSNTYGHISNAIAALVLNSTGRDIKTVDWNMGGNRSWVDDIQEAIYAVVQREFDDERQRLCDKESDGNLCFPDVRDYLNQYGVSVWTEPNGDFTVSHFNDSAADWFISSSLLECVTEGQIKAMRALSGHRYTHY